MHEDDVSGHGCGLRECRALQKWAYHAGCPEDATEQTKITPTRIFLRQNIANPPCLVDTPGLLCVVVKQRICSGLTDEGLAVRLDIPLFVR
jgi:hypothetical protein